MNTPVLSKLKTILNIRRINRNPADFFRKELLLTDGVLKMYLPNGPVSVSDNPLVIKHILQKNNKNYSKTETATKVVKERIGNGLLTSEGKYWLKQRRAIQPGFHRQRLEDISVNMVKEINHYLDTVFDLYAEKEEEVDLHHTMTTLAFRVVSKSLFGSEVAQEKLDKLDYIITEGQHYIINQLRKPYLKKWYKFKGETKKNDALKAEGNKIIAEIISERKNSTTQNNDLLDLLIETRYEDGTGMTDQQLLDEALILYVAGHETSAVALSWAWYLIFTHPEVEKKLADSIPDKELSFNELPNLGYTLQVVEESMRLYPPAWIVDRLALEDDSVEGFNFSKGEEVLALIYSLHRNPKYWKDPEEFNPERFTAENKANHHPFSYIPFGGGPRFCIGNNFALMEMQLIIGMMMKRYKFEILPNQKIEINPLVTLRPRYGIKAIIKKRTP